VATQTLAIEPDSIAVITWENPEFDLGSLDLPTRVGWQFPVNPNYPEREESLDSQHPVHTFRLRDEDGEIHYKGLVRNDPWGENQSDLSDWGASDTGGFLIEVHLDGKWVMEIG
jgi:hypothetical protein